VSADLIAEARRDCAMARSRGGGGPGSSWDLVARLADALESVMADRRILTADLYEARRELAEAAALPATLEVAPGVHIEIDPSEIVIPMENGPDVTVHSEEQAAAFRAAAEENTRALGEGL